ncbi:hypothetical protein [Bradyrhizobium sp. LA7.1]|uniref:hypothetical protein n=1 Tax=Bradyrhizobium sp. LA7.1 TaxID=3156324 RepID=UPI003397A635
METFAYSVYMILQVDIHRAALWKDVQNGSLAWIVLILALSSALLAMAGLRWIWIRLRDVVASA